MRGYLSHMMERGAVMLFLSLLIAVEIVVGEIESRFEHLKQQPLQRLWGIPDTTAQIGFLLHYQIPRSAFDGSISKFKAYSENGDELPSWLIFHEKSGIFEGVPSEEDLGEYYITIEAFGENLQNSAKDVFAVEVLSKSASHAHMKTECKKTDEKTILSLVLDLNFSTLTAKLKVFLLKNFAEFLNVKKELIFMSHVVDKHDPLADNVINAGPGNIIQRSSSGPAAVLSLQIGCSGNVWDRFSDHVDLIETNSKNGELATILRSPIIGWKLTHEDSDFRKRRETPGLNLIDPNEDLGGGVPDPRVVVENTETPVFQIDPSPTYTLDSLPATHKRRHHRGEPNSETAAPQSSIMATPTFKPDRPSIPASPRFEPDSVYISNDISPTAVVDATSPSTLYENSTDGSAETDGEGWPASSSSVTTSYDLSDYSSGLPVNGPTPALPENPTTLENVSYETKNFPPNIGQRLKKLVVTAGKVLRYKIPDEAFSDLEDGNSKDLTLQLLTTATTGEKTALSDNSWIQLDGETKEIYALPLEEHVSRWVYTLRAIDSGGLSAEDQIEISVQNHKYRRNKNHAFTVELASVPAGFTLDWELKLLTAIAETIGASDSSNITVLSVSFDPPIFTWTDDSISRSGCPTSEIENIHKVLSSEDGLRTRVANLMDSLVKKISWTGLGHCETKTTKTDADVPLKSDNLKPAPRNQVDHLNATFGQLLIFQVPEDTFYDPEDGNTRNLKLSLLTMNERARIPSNHWLQFDTKNQEFYGIPFTVGSTEYQLVCEDSGGLDASDVLVVTVQPAVKVMYNVEFSMTLALEFNDFVENPKMQRSFVEKLALVFGDPNTNSIVISGFVPGSTVVTWHNKSLPTNYCPNSDILALRKIMLGDDEKVTQTVLKVMAPEFPVISTKLTPTGYCQGALTEISTGINEQVPNNGVTAVENSEHYIIGLVIPALVIAVMLLCAGLVACILYRRKRTGKMSVGDEDDRQTFRSKGIPVIFQDELDERPEPTNKSPVIMKEEKPPLPPPEYHRGPPLATTALLSDTEDSPYQPPPPFTTSRDSARPKPTPTYRMPPPYVPP